MKLIKTPEMFFLNQLLLNTIDAAANSDIILTSNTVIRDLTDTMYYINYGWLQNKFVPGIVKGCEQKLGAKKPEEMTR